MGMSLWLNGGINKPLWLDKLVQGHLGEILSGILPVLAGITVAAVQGVRVYMTAYRCLAQHQHSDGDKKPTAKAGRLKGGYAVHPITLKLI